MPPSAYVVVLGDLGRSPRMCNHALSLAEEGVAVTMVGYDGGSRPPRRLTDREEVTLRHMAPYPESLARSLPRLASYVLKTLWQTFTLFLALPIFSGVPDVLLLQNPPSIPTLAVCQWYCKFATMGRTKLVIDWHNYGHTILAMSAPAGSLLLRAAEWTERTFGRGAAANFCVTDAMRRDLEENWGVGGALTLYDRAPEEFRPLSDQERSAFLSRMRSENPGSFEEGSGLLVSSTSWTEDEDFGVLLHALDAYEEAREAGRDDLPKLQCVITGRGPMKKFYCDRVAERRWQHVKVLTPWLEAEDYPRLLACADLGVSLHTSSSGLDLPMKVVDMLGCGTPVAAADFAALPELVKEGVNGTAFETREELADAVSAWFAGHPAGTAARRAELADGVAAFGAVRWREYWRMTAWPVVEALLR